MLKRVKNGKTVMMYKDNTNEFEMPDRNLGLYVMEFLFLICRRKDKSLAAVPRLDSHVTQTRGIVVKTPL
jgi:hypothetical protein